MRRKRVEQDSINAQFLSGDGAGCGDLVHQRHQRGDRRVEFQRFGILAHLFDRLVERGFQLFAHAVALDAVLEIPVAFQEPAAAAHAFGFPRSSLFKVADEHLVQTHRSRAVLFHSVVGVDDIAARFAHLLTVRAEDHAVAGALRIRFRRGNLADIVEEFVPETAVQQMERCVLHAAVVPVDRGPVFEGLLAGKLLVVVRIHVAQEVP